MSLSPVHTIGDQIIEVIQQHRTVGKAEARERAIEMLHKVGIPQAAGTRGRLSLPIERRHAPARHDRHGAVVQPGLLIADEPTTALDVTTQAQILELMLSLQRELGMAIMLITHNLGVVAEICEQVIVMYLGEVVEQRRCGRALSRSAASLHQALLRSIPVLGQSKLGRLDPIKGMVPDPYNRPPGCAFTRAAPSESPGKCDQAPIPLIELKDGRAVRCVLVPMM